MKKDTKMVHNKHEKRAIFSVFFYSSKYLTIKRKNKENLLVKQWIFCRIKLPTVLFLIIEIKINNI